jgi:hypothetical protein
MLHVLFRTTRPQDGATLEAGVMAGTAGWCYLVPACLAELPSTVPLCVGGKEAEWCSRTPAGPAGQPLTPGEKEDGGGGLQWGGVAANNARLSGSSLLPSSPQGQGSWTAELEGKAGLLSQQEERSALYEG